MTEMDGTKKKSKFSAMPSSVVMGGPWLSICKAGVVEKEVSLYYHIIVLAGNPQVVLPTLACSVCSVVVFMAAANWSCKGT